MAEGSSERKVYFTRFKRRSDESLGSNAPQNHTWESRDENISSDGGEFTTSNGSEVTSIESSGHKSLPRTGCINSHAFKTCQDSVVDLTLSDSKYDPDSTCQDNIEDSKDDRLECAICLQACIHPTRLPCGHIFCFLCVKGAAHGNKKCAMCRSPIPNNYFTKPDLLETPEELLNKHKDGYSWFYEGRNGWWQYDQRAAGEIESAWEAGTMECELLIAGYVYVIDFRDMYQVRKGQPSKLRRIKRDYAFTEKLGVAGLRDPNAPVRRHSEGDKISREEEEEYYSSESQRRSSFDSSRNVLDFLEPQFPDLSLNDPSDDDDSYQ